MQDQIKQTERGWPGHFICGSRCIFHRNTLLEYKKYKVVISTVGNMIDYHAKDFPNKITINTVGTDNRIYETMAFHANPKDIRYFDIDATQQIYFNSPWSINRKNADDEANIMHDNVVQEFIFALINNTITPYSDEESNI